MILSYWQTTTLSVSKRSLQNKFSINLQNSFFSKMKCQYHLASSSDMSSSLPRGSSSTPSSSSSPSGSRSSSSSSSSSSPSSSSSRPSSSSLESAGPSTYKDCWAFHWSASSLMLNTWINFFTFFLSFFVFGLAPCNSKGLIFKLFSSSFGYHRRWRRSRNWNCWRNYLCLHLLPINRM